MEQKLRVLVVDDAVLARKIVGDVIAEESDMEVASTASNGKIAVQKFPALNPDIVILDFEMPEMNGIETIEELRKLSPKIPIVMFSAFTESGARETLEALARGANDYVTKPVSSSGLPDAKLQVKAQLIPKIRALCRGETHASPAKAKPVPTAARAEIPHVAIDCLAIGVSTGGPNALAELIPLLPSDLPVPVLITQHMPPTFTKMLAERLASKSKIKVVEGEDGQIVRAGVAYIAPGGFHMIVHRTGGRLLIGLNQEPPENSCRPAVDVMLRSVVTTFGANVISLILTGMGQDGKIGSEKVRSAGGIVLAQDEKSSVVWGMPGAVVQAGLAHVTLPLGEVAGFVDSLIRKHELYRGGH